jgi:hypothetical protein
LSTVLKCSALISPPVSVRVRSFFPRRPSQMKVRKPMERDGDSDGTPRWGGE